ncbi:MAG: sulfurtransferase [Candidatus Binataceae bacterium]
MAKLVASVSVAERLGTSKVTLIDPRRPMKYLSGHLAGAINVPAYKAFGTDGKLLAPNELSAWIGGAGLGDSVTPVLYDSPEGQNAAMLAWILEYLGRTDVEVMDAFFEQWKAEGREVLYKPVEAPTRHFTVHLNPAIRATLAEVREQSQLKLVDFRSAEEFTGARDTDGHPGHIPGAANIVWRDLARPPARLLAPRDQLERMFADASVRPGEKIIAYCRSGPRAALGYLALRELGYDVQLYDGSYAEWASSGLPVEK